MREITKIIILIIAITILFFILKFVVNYAIEISKIEHPNNWIDGTYKSDDEIWCEKREGLYIKGGIFSSPNCIIK